MQKIIGTDNSSEKTVVSNISLICYIYVIGNPVICQTLLCVLFYLCPSTCISDFVAALLAKLLFVTVHVITSC